MRKVFMGAFVVSMVSLPMAQHLEVGVDGGYGLGLGTALVGHNSAVDASWTTTKYEEVYSPGGAGLKMGGEVTFFLNDNMGFMVASGYSMFGGYSTEMNQPSDSVQNTIHSSYLPINVGLKIKAKMGIIEPYLCMAPGVYFPKRDSSFIHATDVQRDTIKTTYFYALGWGVSASVGAVIRISEMVGIKLEITPTYAFAKQSRKEKVEKGITYTYIFKDDATEFPPNNQVNTWYVHDAPRDSYNSVAVKVGVCVRIL
ncbi:MAG: hypothetical protein JW699_05140 [Chitinispirillaceae bacterium]|nr:hypothetical protein [Chitinispirillaceae bacterium]